MTQTKISFSVPKWVLYVVAGILVAGLASAGTFLISTSVATTSREASQAIASASASASASETASASASAAERERLSIENELRILVDAAEMNICGAAFDYPNVSYTVGPDGKSATLRSPDGWQVKCITYNLDGPSSVYEQVLITRAIDGTRTASWGNWTANWTYHPDQGINFIIQHD